MRTEVAYSQRLLGLINQLSSPALVTPLDGSFELQNQSFSFGANELQGLKVFFTQSSDPQAQHVGNCVSCHHPPNFTDFKFHNTGASQIEYDTGFGQGAFAALDIPDVLKRNHDFDEYLPASVQHPNASGRFRSPTSSTTPGYTDLGVWNIVANPDIPAPQEALVRSFAGNSN